MRAKAMMTETPNWPVTLAAPLYDPDLEPAAGDRQHRTSRQLDVGPIELRIGDGEGPAAIAILE